MTPLEQQAADYLRIRRALGFKLERAEKLLAQYLAYLDATGQDRVTVDNALAVGEAAGVGERELVGVSALSRALLRDLSERAGPCARDPASRRARPPAASRCPIPLYRPGDRRVDGRHQPAPRPAATGRPIAR